MTDDENTAKLRELHAASLASVRELADALTAADSADEPNDDAHDAAREAIHENALSVEVRSGWYGVHGGTESGKAPAEFRILLTWGGPAVQIVGELDEHGEPKNARLEVQDWFLPWTSFATDTADTEALTTYARCFYFDEG